MPADRNMNRSRYDLDHDCCIYQRKRFDVERKSLLDFESCHEPLRIVHVLPCRCRMRRIQQLQEMTTFDQ
ncbi:hypothetical protein RB195_018140 [Necator americanus]|uniref:Uncharacterized protein n=1 Tax=Necator americanus TaxID=51031 RepID=A0ABR1C9F5_NECAM